MTKTLINVSSVAIYNDMLIKRGSAKCDTAYIQGFGQSALSIFGIFPLINLKDGLARWDTVHVAPIVMLSMYTKFRLYVHGSVLGTILNIFSLTCPQNLCGHKLYN